MEAVNDGSSFVMSYAMERLTDYLRSILMHNEPNQEIETKQMILPYRSHTDDVKQTAQIASSVKKQSVTGQAPLKPAV